VTVRPLRARAALLLVVLLALGCGRAMAPAAPVPAPPQSVPVLRPEVLAEVPHDPTAFTQGLEIDGDDVVEGTGLEGRSQLRELDPATGAVRRAVPLPDRYFGEGLTVVGGRVWQLTWRDGVALEWDRATLSLRREVPLDGEGWGLCFQGLGSQGVGSQGVGSQGAAHGGRLVRSDGTDRLRFHDADTFAEQGSVAVTLDGAPVSRLNELECVGGEVWANVWQTDELVRIDPRTGTVTAVVNAAALLDPQRRANADAVLNGITALGDDEYLLAGKLWPVSFRVRFTPM
jgi:putative peptide zinc metalloprotease protein